MLGNYFFFGFLYDITVQNLGIVFCFLCFCLSLVFITFFFCLEPSRAPNISRAHSLLAVFLFHLSIGCLILDVLEIDSFAYSSNLCKSVLSLFRFKNSLDVHFPG